MTSLVKEQLRAGGVRPSYTGRSIAVLIPCYNEEITIGSVIDDFRAELPSANFYVFDNNSSDRSAEIAKARGATVLRVPIQGKGQVVQSMFDRIAADLYVMVDGDGTYPASSVHELIVPLIEESADMVVGARHATEQAAFRKFHRLGNSLVRNLINLIWSARLTDIMSGYRAFSATIAQALPLISAGFEVETEMTIQMFDKGFCLVERPIVYGVRPHGSRSKLRTLPDGVRVIFLILRVFKDYKPLTFFGSFSLLFGGLSAFFGFLMIRSWIFVPSLAVVPYGIVFVVTGLFCAACLTIGLVLHTVNWKLREIYSLMRRRVSDRIQT